MTYRNRALMGTAVALAVAAALLAGCASKGPTYVDNGQAHTKASALALLAQADSSAVSTKPASDGEKLRRAALVALRQRGASASAAADLLTKVFPAGTASVPVYIERGSYDGKPAILVVEATGPASGTLDAKRLWVLDESGNILLAGTR